MANENKKFNYGLYAVAAFVIVAVVVVLITTFTFKSKYIAFDEEKVAVNYTDTIVQKGDGYNAYKYTLASKDDKYGDFIRKNYIYPAVYPDYEIGGSTKGLDGFNSDKHKSDATANDDGSLAGKLADAMYPYYVELVETYGWDNYDVIYSSYIAKLIEVRQGIFGDDYLSDEVVFTALEANVATYGDNLTGTKAVTDETSGVTTGEDKIGAYQTAYGEDYKLTAKVTGKQQIEELDAYKAALDADVLATYGVAVDDITDAKAVTVQVTTEDEAVVAELTVYEVKIGSTWYVDNLSTDTTSVYANAAALV